MAGVRCNKCSVKPHIYEIRSIWGNHYSHPYQRVDYRTPEEASAEALADAIRYWNKRSAS